MRSKLWVGILGLQMLLLPATLAGKESEPRKVRLGDVTTVEGVRDNLLIGYGMVVGLNGTGDRQQTVFSVQTLSNLLQKMGVQFTRLGSGGQKCRRRLRHGHASAFCPPRHAD